MGSSPPINLLLDTHIWVGSTLGRMRLSRRVVDALGTLTLREAPMGFDIAQETARVQLPHRDPADCFLIATARIFGLPLVTGDETILKSVAVLANR